MPVLSTSPSRIYIVYHDGLFAQGMRSLLECRQSAEIVGMESDTAKALVAMHALKPEVVIVEESSETDRPSGLVAAFLEEAVAPRIVSLSLSRDYATVYESARVPTRSAAEFDMAIRGSVHSMSSEEDMRAEALPSSGFLPLPLPNIS